jgi:hypothetical protein
MEGDPGYCGRDERKDCPESFKRLKLDIDGRRRSPVGLIYSMAEWEQRVWRVCNEYNHTKQEGKMTAGKSPMEAYEAYQDKSNPLMHFPAQVQHLLAHQKFERTVSAHGIVTLKSGQRYVCEESAPLHGQTVLIWFNPDSPDVVALTDSRRRVWTATRFSGDGVPAIGGGEQLGQAMREIRAGQERPKTMYRSIKAEFQLQFRVAQTTHRTVEVGAEIFAKREALAVENNQRAARTSRNLRKASAIGLPRQILGDNSESVERGLDRMERALRGENKNEPETSI